MQYDKFCTEVVQKRRVFTFTEDGELLVYPVHGNEVVPFWSSQARLEKIALAHPKYAKFELSEYSHTQFEQYLCQLESEGILVGVNWSGARLVGYNVPVNDLRASMSTRAASAV